MTITVKHNKTNAIADWTQAQLDEQIALGNFAPGTTLANIVLPSDWNSDHTFTGTLDVGNGGTGATTLTGYVKGNGTSALTASATIPNTDISGLGTISTQNANNVAITGGSINGTTIGATTASTGKFTSVTTPSVTATTTDLTLSAISTGLIKFNTVNGEAFRVVDIGSTTTNFMRVSGGTSGNAPSFYSVGGDTNVDFACNTKGTGAFRFYTNQAQEQLRISHTASAVNYVQVTGAATTLAPVISAQGSDANIQLQIQSKGTGLVRFSTGSGLQAYISDTSSPVNQLVLTGSATTVAPKLSVAGTDTNIDLALTPKGTGLVRFGTYTAGAPTATGYINIKAADGTTYKVLVST
jgi:hypothetical protein